MRWAVCPPGGAGEGTTGRKGQGQRHARKCPRMVASREGGRGGLLRSSKDALPEKFQARKARETGGLLCREMAGSSLIHRSPWFFSLELRDLVGVETSLLPPPQRGVGRNNSQRCEGINFAGERCFLTFLALRCPGILASKGKRRKKTEEMFAWRKFSGGWAAAHSFSLVTPKAQAQKIGTQKRGRLWA